MEWVSHKCPEEEMRGKNGVGVWWGKRKGKGGRVCQVCGGEKW